jgi:hypothetical protein
MRSAAGSSGRGVAVPAEGTRPTLSARWRATCPGAAAPVPSASTSATSANSSQRPAVLGGPGQRPTRATRLHASAPQRAESLASSSLNPQGWLDRPDLSRVTRDPLPPTEAKTTRLLRLGEGIWLLQQVSLYARTRFTPAQPFHAPSRPSAAPAPRTSRFCGPTFMLTRTSSGCATAPTW